MFIFTQKMVQFYHYFVIFFLSLLNKKTATNKKTAATQAPFFYFFASASGSRPKFKLGFFQCQCRCALIGRTTLWLSGQV